MIHAAHRHCAVKQKSGDSSSSASRCELPPPLQWPPSPLVHAGSSLLPGALGPRRERGGFGRCVRAAGNLDALALNAVFRHLAYYEMLHSMDGEEGTQEGGTVAAARQRILQCWLGIRCWTEAAGTARRRSPLRSWRRHR